MTVGDDFSDGTWAVERRSVINQLRDTANRLSNVQQTVVGTREAVIGIERDLKALVELLNGEEGIRRSLRAVEARVLSLEGSRTWIKGVMAAVAVLWTIFLIYLAARLKP